MSDQWQELPSGSTTALTPGTYRIRGTVKGPYNPVTTGALKVGLAAHLATQGNRLVGFDHAPPLMNAHDFTLGPWPFIARFERPADEPTMAGVNVAAVALLVTAVAALALGLSLLSTKVDKLLQTLSDTLKPVLSPGTLVLAVLAIFLITRARKRVTT